MVDVVDMRLMRLTGAWCKGVVDVGVVAVPGVEGAMLGSGLSFGESMGCWLEAVEVVVAPVDGVLSERRASVWGCL